MTLLDAASSGAGLTNAEIARDLQVYAASQHKIDTCHAATLQRYAAQVSGNLNASQAIAAWTTTPTANQTVDEVTVGETALAESVLSENSLTDPAI